MTISLTKIEYRVRISVKDSGIGIPEEQIASIFLSPLARVP